MNRALSKKNLWEKTPPAVKSTLALVLDAVPSTVFLGRRFREILNYCHTAETWTVDQVRDHQIECLRDLVTLAYDKSPFYRAHFDAAGVHPTELKTLEDLAAWPTIDKRVVREHLEALCTESPAGRGIDCVSTGGTGGEPLKFYIGAERSAFEYAHLVAGWQRIGFQLSDRLAVFRGEAIRPDRQGLRHYYDPILKRHGYSNFHMSDEDLARYVDHVASIGRCFLHVYPSSVTALTAYLRRHGRPAPGNIQGILAGSEKVCETDRRRSEEVFGVPYHSWYGHSEKSILGAECRESTDYHMWPTYGICELIDETGAVVTTPGQEGEVVATGFMNRVMPFIRYRTGDYATYVGQTCSACGRAHMVIRDVQGHRTQEMVVGANGGLISWTALNMHDTTFEDVRQFQLRQEEPGRAVLRVVPAAGYGDAVARRILENLGRKLDGQIQLTIEVTDSIPLTARGKVTYVDQRLDLEALSTTGQT